MKMYHSLLFLLLLPVFTQCKSPDSQPVPMSDEALMDTVQRSTFNYFWDGAEPNSGLAPERIHMDGVYPEDDRNVVTSGGSGFVIVSMHSIIGRGNSTRSSRSCVRPTAFTVSIPIGGMEKPAK